MPTDPASGAPDCPHVREWMSAPPRGSGPLDGAALSSIAESLSEIGVKCARAGWTVEYRAALLKMLAAVDSAPGLAFTEDDVFARSNDLREALYLETMTYRRAARADLDVEALHG